MTKAEQIKDMVEKDLSGDFFTRLDDARKKLADEDPEMRVAYEKINSRNNGTH